MKKLLTLVLTLLTGIGLLAQNRVTGKVTSSQDGAPVAFASVVVKGTMNGVASDDNGAYVLDNVPANAVLVFSSIGFTDLEVVVGGRSVIDAILAPNAESLEETIVVAYGTAKKGSYTGSAAAVGSDKFDLRPVTGITSALAGTTAGVQVSTVNGMPGSDPTIRIRGIGSFNANNSPLIVLDGMPYDNAISSINPNDIESMTILKDASSAALYGARAANGVLLITTKKGRSDKLTVEAGYNLGFSQRQTKDYETLGLNDYMQIYWEAARNAIVYGGASMADANARAGNTVLTGMGFNIFNMGADQLFDSGTGAVNPSAKLLWGDDLNWLDYVQRTGIRHDANVSISGASKKADYYTSVGYTRDEGYIVGTFLERYSAKANANSQITKWLKVGTNLNAAITMAEGQQSESSGNNNNPFRFIRYVGNIYPVHVHYPDGRLYVDDSGEPVFDFGIGYDLPDGTSWPKRDYMTAYNHAAEVAGRYNGYKRANINAKAYAEITFLRDFTFTVTAGLGENLYRSHSADVVYEAKGNNGTSTKSVSNTTTWTINEILNWSHNFGKHHVDAMVGHESYDYTYSYQTASMKTQIIVGRNFEFANYVEANSVPNSYEHNYAVEGYLSRLNYDFAGKYFLSGSFRRDGSSRFYKDVRWGNFWSVGAGWRVDNEPWMKSVSWVDMLKLRASYGLVGNDDVDSYYPWMATYVSRPNGTAPGYLQSSLGSTTLTWEESANFDAAVEFSLGNGAFAGTIEFFNRESSNLLFSVPQPLSSGVDDVDMNAGTMYNRGIEFTFDWRAVKTRDFQWNINGNVTWLKNRITSLPIDPYTSSPYKIEEGHSRYEFWLRQWEGVNPETGYSLFLADTGNPDFAFADDELISYNGKMCTENIEHAKWDWSGNAMPPFIGGFGTQLRWRNFTLGLDFYYQLGGIYSDSTYGSLMTTTTSSAGSPGYHKLHVDILNRWQKAGDVTNVPKVSGTTDATNIDAGSSTRWLTSSNMLELTNVYLSYDMPAKALNALRIEGLKFYFSADNTFLLTPRRGMFPRRTTYSGYDGNSNLYLPARTFSLGMKVNF